MAADKFKLPVDGILSLETPFIKVPYEQLKRANKKTQKHTEKELGNLISALSDLAKGKGAGATNPVKVVESLTDRLKKLKRKLKELGEEETLYAHKIQARLHHLQELSHIKTLDSPTFGSWTHTRLNRLLVEYMLREGFIESASMLAKGSFDSVHNHNDPQQLPTKSTNSTPSSNFTVGGLVGSALANQLDSQFNNGQDADLENYADLEFFLHARKIECALREHRCTEALAWCNENRTNLKKLKSTFEFNLRIQEFIDLASKRDLIASLNYAKQYLVAYSDTNMPQIQQAIALLAFPPTTTCEPYRTLYDTEARWSALISQFRADNYALHSLPLMSALEITMLAGLSGLKTARCSQHQDRNPNCPVCAPDTYGELAQGLPLSHRANSSYVCRITGVLMNEDNPPMATPDGYVYSFQAVQDMASKNEGQFRCPRTGSVYPVGNLKKLYLT